MNIDNTDDEAWTLGVNVTVSERKKRREKKKKKKKEKKK